VRGDFTGDDAMHFFIAAEADLEARDKNGRTLLFRVLKGIERYYSIYPKATRSGGGD
jgi:hypothetical protein